jgi:hypothetical protein
MCGVTMNPFELEKKMQPFMDDYYISNDWTVDRSQASKKFDVIVGGRKIEEKYLQREKMDQFLVEIIQEAKLPKIDWGWFYHCEADYFAWIHCRERPVVACFIKMTDLRESVYKTLESKQFMQFNVCVINYGLTINLPIKWNTIKHKEVRF